MSNAGSNSLWGGLQQSLTDLENGNITQAASDVEDAILGPSFDYTSRIQSPSSLGVGQDGSIGQVITNAQAIGTYTSNLTLGPLQGNQYFLNTGGMCTVSSAGDPNNGQTVPRFTFVNNAMTGKDVLADFPGLENALGGDLATFEGIIPGMMGDVVATNPITILNALMLPGTPSCQAYSCPTTDKLGNSTGNQTYYLTPGLEQSIGDCTLQSTANISGLATSESFAPFWNPSFEPMAKPVGPTMTDKILYAGAVLLAIGMATLKE
jgi:hypothetical protein